MSLDRAFVSQALQARSVTVGAAFEAAPGVSTDTRTIGDGDLFVALVGERFDAHDFVKGALDKGASAALVARPVEGGRCGETDLLREGPIRLPCI